MKLKTRMWIAETDNDGLIRGHMYLLDDPEFIPRIGEFVESEEATGWVKRVKWNYDGPETTIVYVFLR